MLSFEEAKRIGLDACIDRLGREFVQRYAESSTSAFGEFDQDKVFCFVGVDDEPHDPGDEKTLVLTKREFPYRSSCTVTKSSGDIVFLEERLPA